MVRRFLNKVSKGIGKGLSKVHVPKVRIPKVRVPKVRVPKVSLPRLKKLGLKARVAALGKRLGKAAKRRR